jgi:hypothetical protein
MCWDDTLNSTSPNPKLNPELKHDTNMWVDLPERVYCGRRLVSAQHPVLDADVCRCVYVCMCMCTCVSFFCVSFQMVCVCVCVCVTCVCVCVCVCVWVCVICVRVSRAAHMVCVCQREYVCVYVSYVCVCAYWFVRATCCMYNCADVSVWEARVRVYAFEFAAQGLAFRVRRPTLVSKETYTSVKRDLH